MTEFDRFLKAVDGDEYVPSSYIEAARMLVSLRGDALPGRAMSDDDILDLIWDEEDYVLEVSIEKGLVAFTKIFRKQEDFDKHETHVCKVEDFLTSPSGNAPNFFLAAN